MSKADDIPDSAVIQAKSRRIEELEDAVSKAIFAIDHGRIDDARSELDEAQSGERTSPHEVYHDDVLTLLQALDLGTHARPESPHQVVHSEILSAIKQLRQKRTGLEAEVGRLRNASDSLMCTARSVLRAKEPVPPRLWRGLSASISSMQNALDAAEDGQDE